MDIFLGIDPGSKRIGYGLIAKKGSTLSFLSAGILRIGAENSSEQKQKNLLAIRNQISELINIHQPKSLAIEKLFFSKNKKTVFAVSESRGVVLLSAAENKIKVQEFSPNEIKLAVTGYGLADKTAVCKMVKLILKEPKLKMIDDAIDALAVAITASQKTLD